VTVTKLPFKAVLLGCDQGHYEATLEEHSTLTGMSAVCIRCGHSLRLVKTVTITPGGGR
jgi:hypothetical protein